MEYIVVVINDEKQKIVDNVWCKDLEEARQTQKDLEEHYEGEGYFIGIDYVPSTT